MDVKDKVYISLQECLNESEKIPTSQIADNLHLSRQIVTHYLNQLFDEGKVKKTDTRPTYWYIEKEEQSASVEEKLDSEVFDSMIGATGSHKKIYITFKGYDRLSKSHRAGSCGKPSGISNTRILKSTQKSILFLVGIVYTKRTKI